MIYCRESRDEGGLNRSRIETQREILEGYVKSAGLGDIIGVIMDDDVTGTDFKRLDSLCAMAERGELDAVLFKDSSRLGRNLTESLLFREKMEECGVELIFESGGYNEDIFPLEAWFHEQRAKEDSRKIRRVLRHKMENGGLVISPPYGYRREGKGLVPSDEAPVVREIFEAFAAGSTTGEIARSLDLRGIATPSEIKGIKKASTGGWSRASIRRILADESYSGSLVCAKTSGRSFKDKKRLENPCGSRIIYPNHHEALIDNEILALVGRKLGSSARGSGSVSPFGGKIFCGACGNRMSFRKRKNRPDAYICTRKGCGAHRVRVCDIERAAVNLAAALLAGSERGSGEGTPETLYERLYEDYLSGRITQSFFERAREEYLSRERARRNGRISYAAAREMADRFPKELSRLLFGRIEVFAPGDKGYDGGSITLLLKLAE